MSFCNSGIQVAAIEHGGAPARREYTANYHGNRDRDAAAKFGVGLMDLSDGSGGRIPVP